MATVQELQEAIRKAVVAQYCRDNSGLTVKQLASWVNTSERRIRSAVADGVEGLSAESETRENSGAYSNYVGGVHRVTVYYPTRAYLAQLLKAGVAPN